MTLARDMIPIVVRLRAAGSLAAAMLFAPGGAGLTWALDGTRELSQYHHESWGRREGLTSNVVRALATSDDLLWIGTPEGLVRFDGARFSRAELIGAGSLLGAASSALHADRGLLWLGSDESAGLASIDAGLVARPVALPAEGDRSVRAVVSDQTGRVWAATAGGVALVEGTRVRMFGRTDGLPATSARAVAVAPDGTPWVGTQAGVARWANGRFVAEGPSVQVRCLHVDADGTVWAGTESGLHARSETGWRRIAGTPALADETVTALLRDRDGNLWIGTRRGLARLSRDGRLSSGANTDLALPVRALLEDREGSLWIGTGGAGLHRLRDGLGMPFTTRNGLPTDRITGVVVDGEGAVWMATADAGVARLRDGVVTTFQETRGSAFGGAGLVALDERGRPRLHTGGGSARLEGDRFVPVASPPDTVPVYSPSGPRLWVSLADAQLLDESGASLGHLPLPERSPRVGAIIGMQMSPGTLWLGYRTTLVERRADGSFHAHRFAPGAPYEHISGIVPGQGGGVWVATAASGVLRFSKGSLARIGRAQGLGTDRVFGLVDDGAGRLWISAPSGIGWARKDDLTAVAEGRRPGLQTVWYSIEEGVEISGVGEPRPAAARMPDGRLWFATAHGLLAVDPARLPGASPADVVVERASVDGHPLAAGHELRVPPGPGALEIVFRPRTLLAPELLRFGVRLEGLDEEWNDIGAERNVRYRGLPPGRYRFRVRAQTRGGVVRESAVTLGFVLRSPWHRTPWFVGGVLILAALAGRWVHRLRLRIIAGRFEAVLSERARVARDIHDGLGQSLVAVSTHLRRARQLLGGDRAAVERHLTEAEAAAADSLAEARCSVQALRGDAPADGLFTALREIAERLSVDGGTRFEVSGSAPAFPEPVRTHVLRIAQEAMTNAIRHARAGMVRVVLQPGRRSFKLKVRDDGGGFDAASDRARTSGYGLKSMSERAALIGGKLAVTSRVPGGTEVELVLPV